MTPSPLFPPNERNVHWWTGYVDRIDENHVGWGNTSLWGTSDHSTKTFDFPIPEGYGIGSRVEMYDTTGDPETENDYLVLVLSPDEQRLTLCFLVEDENGDYQMIDQFETRKEQ